MLTRRPLVLIGAVALFLAGCDVECSQKPNWNPDPPWSAVPVTVDWNDIGPVFDRSISDAMKAWNHAAGCEVLAKVAGPSPADVILSPYDGEACGAHADIESTQDSVAGTWRCGIARAEVKFRAMTDIRSVFVSAEHEFGHVLGLGHDRSALMNPTPELYDPARFGGGSAMMPLPSDADGVAVGARYCRGRR